MKPIILSNEHLELVFHPTTGAMTQFLVKATGWHVVNNPDLQAGLRLLVPVPGHGCNTAYTAAQTLSDASFDGPTKLTLCYDSIHTHKAGILPIAAKLVIELAGNGAALFTVQIENRSDYTIEEVWAPSFAGLRQPEGEPPLQLKYLNMCGGLSNSIRFDTGFHTGTGYWGFENPVVYDNANRVSFFILDNEQQGLYLGQHEAAPRFLSTWVAELKPGYIESLHLRHDPRANELADRPAGFVFSRAFNPFVAPGASVTLPTTTVRPYRGDWHVAAKYYADWRKSWFQPKPLPAWAAETDAWLTLQMDSPEGDARYRYTDLPEIAAECLACGVRAMHLIGYNNGGQDRNVPYIESNPLLGTLDELKTAIRECEAMGVRVILFFKIGWANLDAPDFEREILPHVCRDMKGNPVSAGGWDYSTIANAMGYSRYKGVQLCHNSPAARTFLMTQLRNLLALGASGLQCDEVLQNSPCFNPSHDHSYGEPGPNGSLKAAAETHAIATACDPEFLLAGEGSTDPMTQYYRINYIRTADRYYWAGRHVPAWRYMDPEARFAACIIGFDDRELINQCLTFGYIFCYEPLNFKGLLSDFPKTIAYGQKAQALRKRLCDFLWDGLFRHTEGATVTFAEPDRPQMWSIHEHRGTGKLAVAIANEDATRELAATVALTGRPGARFRIHTVDDLEGSPLVGNTVTIPARSIAVLVEN
ncbi:MAG: DUF6259 domain-containing protein [Verrucomicrobiae bacterium]